MKRHAQEQALAQLRELVVESARNRLGVLPGGIAKPMIRGARIGEPQAQPITMRRFRGRKHASAMSRVSASNDARAFQGIRQNSRAIDELAKSVQALARAVEELQTRGDLSLLEGLMRRFGQLERHVQVAKRMTMSRQGKLEAAFTRQARALRADVKLQARATRLEKLNATAQSMQSSAFGASGSVLAKSNLLLAANQLVWSFGGDLLRALDILPAGATPIQWLAPIGSLLSGQLVLGSQPQPTVSTRFISGIASDFATFSGSGFDPEDDLRLVLLSFAAVTKVSLEGFVGTTQWPEFRKRTDVPVIATVLQAENISSIGEIAVKAFVTDGVLHIALDASTTFANARVAWIVDTGEPNA